MRLHIRGHAAYLRTTILRGFASFGSSRPHQPSTKAHHHITQDVTGINKYLYMRFCIPRKFWMNFGVCTQVCLVKNRCLNFLLIDNFSPVADTASLFLFIATIRQLSMIPSHEIFLLLKGNRIPWLVLIVWDGCRCGFWCRSRASHFECGFYFFRPRTLD